MEWIKFFSEKFEVVRNFKLTLDPRYSWSIIFKCRKESEFIQYFEYQCLLKKEGEYFDCEFYIENIKEIESDDNSKTIELEVKSLVIMELPIYQQRDLKIEDIL